MAFLRGSRRQFPSQSRRRKTAWGLGPGADVLPITAGTNRVLWTFGTILGLDSEVTIVRVRGILQLWLDLATSAGDGFAGAAGMGLVNSDAFAAGAGSIPGPFSDPGWEGWQWHHYWNLRGVAAQSQGQDVSRNANADQLIIIDSKAMRKFSENMTFFGMVETDFETGTAGMVFSANTRVLAKLP